MVPHARQDKRILPFPIPAGSEKLLILIASVLLPPALAKQHSRARYWPACSRFGSSTELGSLHIRLQKREHLA
jgi:hypothetical protein